MPAHPHAALMAEYAKDAMETDKPWERWQHYVEKEDRWWNSVGHPLWIYSKQYRRKISTIMIGDMEVSEPLRVAPPLGMLFYTPSFTYCEKFTQWKWQGDTLDQQLLKNGMVHLTSEAAIQHAKALIKISGGYI